MSDKALKRVYLTLDQFLERECFRQAEFHVSVFIIKGDKVYDAYFECNGFRVDRNEFDKKIEFYDTRRPLSVSFDFELIDIYHSECSRKSVGSTYLVSRYDIIIDDFEITIERYEHNSDQTDE